MPFKSYKPAQKASMPAKKTSSPKKKMKSSSSKADKPVGRINVHVDKDSSMSIRQIENGFIVRESGTTGKGKNQKWYEKEYFTPNNPVKLNTGTKGKFGSKK